MTATHTIHVTGVSSYGSEYRLDCDDQVACIAEADDADGGGCFVRTWWNEVGIELVHGDVAGPPPWQVTSKWVMADEGPELHGLQ